MPNLRKPLSGQLSIRVLAVKDVDHAPTARFSRGPETFVAVKVEDNVAARTKLSRTDRWEGEYHNVDVDKANEIELTVYDKPGEHAIPIGMLWVRISDIAEELRRKRIEGRDQLVGMGLRRQDEQQRARRPPAVPHEPAAAPVRPPADVARSFQQQPGQPQQQGAYGSQLMQPPAAGPDLAGAHHGMVQPRADGPDPAQPSTSSARPRTAARSIWDSAARGAIRQRKEEVHEIYGHKFVQRQFYNIMRCALCGDFLKGGAGMQCEDCKYTCHVKCYTSVVTKCISKSNAETDPDEEKINHRIPHRFQPLETTRPTGAATAATCCPLARRAAGNAQVSSLHAPPLPLMAHAERACRHLLTSSPECGLTAHAQCVHFVPDFCGMSMPWLTRFWMESAPRSSGNKKRRHP